MEAITDLETPFLASLTGNISTKMHTPTYHSALEDCFNLITEFKLESSNRNVTLWSLKVFV